MTQITGPKVLELRNAILNAFSPEEFDDMLLLLDLNRAHVALGPDQRVNVRRVIDYFNMRYQIPNLIRAARMANPHHPALLSMERELGTPNFAIVENVGTVQQPLQSNLDLERYIRTSNGLKERILPKPVWLGWDEGRGTRALDDALGK